MCACAVCFLMRGCFFFLLPCLRVAFQLMVRALFRNHLIYDGWTGVNQSCSLEAGYYHGIDWVVWYGRSRQHVFRTASHLRSVKCCEWYIGMISITIYIVCVFGCTRFAHCWLTLIWRCLVYFAWGHDRCIMNVEMRMWFHNVRMWGNLSGYVL